MYGESIEAFSHLFCGSLNCASVRSGRQVKKYLVSSQVWSSFFLMVSFLLLWSASFLLAYTSHCSRLNCLICTGHARVSCQKGRSVTGFIRRYCLIFVMPIPTSCGTESTASTIPLS